MKNKNWMTKVLLSVLAITAVVGGHRAQAVLTADTVLREKVYEGPTTGNRRNNSVLTQAQTLTTSWADVGSEINTQGSSVLGVWATITQNDAQQVRFRLLPKRESNGTLEYLFMQGVSQTSTTMTNIDTLQPHYFEVVDAANGSAKVTARHIFIPFELYHLVPYVQLQVQVASSTGTAGNINSVYITEGLK